jgi:hypothetical protein
MALNLGSHPPLARLGSSEFFLLELQDELKVSGDKHGQLVDRLTINDTNDGKVRTGMPCNPSHNPLLQSFLTSVPYLGYDT